MNLDDTSLHRHLSVSRVLSDLWVKKEATVHKDCQDWKDHPDPKDLKAKLVPPISFSSKNKEMI